MRKKVVFQNKWCYCEHIFDSDENISLIQKFEAKENGIGLEMYLKHSAAKDEISQNMRTYLVKSKETDELIGYFSLKAGMVTYNEKFFKKGFESLPAIELANFAVNEKFNKDLLYEFEESIGNMMFVDFILPIVKKATVHIGASVLYIFSLPYGKLMKHYTKMGFMRLPQWVERKVHKRIKPNYDKNCIFMYQMINSDII